MSDAPLLEVEGLVRQYRLPRPSLFRPAPVIQALDGVSLSMRAGRSLGVVGESGSGKSTLARAVMGLEPPTAGRVRLFGQDLYALAPEALRVARRDFQMVFQDPYGSLDPRQRVARIVAEPLSALADDDASTRRARAAEALASVGLREADLDKYPHEFSGGQRQRIAIARALVTRPRLIVADEPVSALDVSVQAHVLNLLLDLQERHGITFLLISHDLAVVDRLCDEVAVILQGRIVEQGTPAELFGAAAHPYTRALLEAVPRVERGLGVAGRRARAAAGATAGAVGGARGGTAGGTAGSTTPAVPASAATDASSSSPHRGCAFIDRCPHRQAICGDQAPALRAIGGGHRVACHVAPA
jgi:peptide/nickel transport system ATP-binding protein